MILSNPYVTKRCSEIDSLLADAQQWALKDSKLGAQLAAYLSVMIVGILEDCIENLIADRVSKARDPEIYNYICSMVSARFRNPDFGSISGLLGEFSDKYKEEFKNKITPNGREADAMQSLMSNRHSVTHEGVTNLNLTISDISTYYTNIIPVLQALEQILA
ncbi:MAG: HEPN domain-containing protein [Chloroflexota bacterium]